MSATRARNQRATETLRIEGRSLRTAFPDLPSEETGDLVKVLVHLSTDGDLPYEKVPPLLRYLEAAQEWIESFAEEAITLGKEAPWWFPDTRALLIKKLARVRAMPSSSGQSP